MYMVHTVPNDWWLKNSQGFVILFQTLWCKTQKDATVSVGIEKGKKQIKNSTCNRKHCL